MRGGIPTGRREAAGPQTHVFAPGDIGLRKLAEIVRVGNARVGRGLHDIAAIEEMHLVLASRAAQVAGGFDLRVAVMDPGVEPEPASHSGLKETSPSVIVVTAELSEVFPCDR